MRGRLVMAAACLLVLAAFIEAFVSPSALPASVKHAIGLVNVLWLTLYVAAGGRERAAPPPARVAAPAP